jgi:hypothetical protein
MIDFVSYPVSPPKLFFGLMSNSTAVGFQGRSHQEEDRSQMAAEAHASADEEELIGIEKKQEGNAGGDGRWQHRIRVPPDHGSSEHFRSLARIRSRSCSIAR